MARASEFMQNLSFHPRLGWRAAAGRGTRGGFAVVSLRSHLVCGQAAVESCPGESFLTHTKSSRFPGRISLTVSCGSLVRNIRSSGRSPGREVTGGEPPPPRIWRPCLYGRGTSSSLRSDHLGATTLATCVSRKLTGMEGAPKRSRSRPHSTPTDYA